MSDVYTVKAAYHDDDFTLKVGEQVKVLEILPASEAKWVCNGGPGVAARIQKLDSGEKDTVGHINFILEDPDNTLRTPEEQVEEGRGIPARVVIRWSESWHEKGDRGVRLEVGDTVTIIDDGNPDDDDGECRVVTGSGKEALVPSICLSRIARSAFVDTCV